ncbi:MAG: sodium:solute symporter family transporter, partial [Candidatus Binataceae bacterium]
MVPPCDSELMRRRDFFAAAAQLGAVSLVPAIPMAARSRRVFDVKQFGASGGGMTSDTRAIQAAIDAANHAGGGVVHLPAGIFLCGSVILKSHVELNLDANAMLLGSASFSDYRKIHHWYALLLADRQEHIAISGAGTIDGQGRLLAQDVIRRAKAGEINDPLAGYGHRPDASHGTDQLIVQRLLAARNKRQSQAARLSSGLVILFQFALFLVIGVALFTYYHLFPPTARFARPDQIYPYFVVHSLPAGLAGLVTAAIIAAGMANLSAALNSLSSSSVMDFYRPWIRPGKDERHYMRVSRGMTIFWGAVLIVFALLAHLLKEGVLVLALTVASFPYGSMLGIFLLAALVKKASPRGTLTGALIGLAAVFGVMEFTAVAWTWYVVIGATTTFIIGWIASLLWTAD